MKSVYSVCTSLVLSTMLPAAIITLVVVVVLDLVLDIVVVVTVVVTDDDSNSCDQCIVTSTDSDRSFHWGAVVQRVWWTDVPSEVKG